MSGFTFTRATKSQARARIALIGPSGSGKTYTALLMAQGLGQRIAVIDTENGSASKYAGDLAEFDVLNLGHHDPTTYVKAIQAAESEGYDVIIIDSLSHAWAGSGGALEQVDNAAKRYKGNSYAAWRDVTPKHNALVNALVSCSAHLIVTMRAKTAYELQKDDRGKVAPIKIGLAPVQRDGVEYEFDIVADLDLDHNLLVSKTRMSDLDGLIVAEPGRELGERIAAWLSDGSEAPPPASQGEPEPVRQSTNGHKPAPAKPKEEPHFTETINASTSTLQALSIIPAILEQLPHGPHRVNALTKAFKMSSALARTEGDMDNIRAALRAHGGHLGKGEQWDAVKAAAKAAAERVAEETAVEVEEPEAVEAETEAA